jgi:hypothetical protein
MIRVSLRLIQRSHDFLVGAWVWPRGSEVDAFTQPFWPAEEERVRTFLLGYPGVTAIRELFPFDRSRPVRIVARVDIDDGLRGVQVTSLVRGIESGLKHEADEVYRVDVVAIGGA